VEDLLDTAFVDERGSKRLLEYDEASPRFRDRPPAPRAFPAADFRFNEADRALVRDAW
jgi:hypothetical protein